MNEYELLYIVAGRRPADDVSEVIDWVAGVIADAGGEVLSVNNWGRRRFAYPINHEFEGYYVFTTLSLSAESTRTVESALTISEDVIRHLLIRGIIPSDGSPPPEFVGERPRTMQAPVAAAPSAEAVAEAPEPEAAEAVEADAASEPAEAPAVEAVEAAGASVDPAATTEPGEAAEAARDDEETEQRPAEPSPAATSSE